MIGLVIVSHSAKIAEGVADLARGMAGADLPVVAAGGLDDPTILGTDALRVLSAIEGVYSGDGVLVLVDLGSAVLSAETALDFLSDEMRPRVLLCPAPLVEGAVAVAVAARAGQSLEQAAEAARNSLGGKQRQTTANTRQAEGANAAMVISVPNRLGLHARPAAKLVEIASRFRAEIRLRDLDNGREASARSFNALMLLGAVGGHRLDVSASGADAEQALAAVQAFAAANFGDPQDDAPVIPAAQSSSPGPVKGRLTGLAAAPGIAIGAAKHYRTALPEITAAPARDVQAETAALLIAIERATGNVEAQRAQAERQPTGSSAAGIFAAHLAFLRDPDVRGAAPGLIEQGQNAASAWKTATDRIMGQYRQADDAYLRGRAADVQALQAQVLAALLGQSAEAPRLAAPGILIARDLTPAEVGALDPALALGIACAEGSPTSHAAILARMLGIPAVVGLGAGILDLSEGAPLIVDGSAGLVFVEPNDDLRRESFQAQEAYRQSAQAALQASAQPARTADGARIEVYANAAGANDAARAVGLGAEGVGVLRTEFIFMRRDSAPTGDEQYAAYRAVAAALDGRPLVIRTLDVGGDKPLPYLGQPREANPFLGLRGVRLSLAYPDLFHAQLSAIARLAGEFPVRAMFPMIATRDEFRAAKALLDAARAECDAPPIPTGMMVEVPAAVEMAAAFARDVDFFSIGTNDLTQYVFAAERGNPQVAALSDALHPAILRMIGRVVDAGHAQGKPTAVCGEMASDPAAIPVLVGLGVAELSMSAAAIPQAKAAIRQVTTPDAEALARAALGLETAAQVRALVRERFGAA
jgi:phosphocarrier protein FPr